MSTLATLAFIGAAAAAGGYLAQRETVIDGKVMASDLMTRLANKQIAGMECDPEIPITGAGAVFRCDATGTDGSTAEIEYTMDRAGSLSGALVESTGPTTTPAPLSGDPWAN